MIKPSFLAFALESSAMAALFSHLPPLVLIPSFLILHGGASLATAWVLLLITPAEHRQPKHWTLAFYTALVFFIPLLSIVAALTAALIIHLVPARHRTHLDFAEVDSVAFGAADQAGKIGKIQLGNTNFGEGGIRARLNNQAAPLPTRVKALLATQNMPSRLVSPILRDVLTAPEDDLRLLAYGLLDQQEKRINDRIHEQLTILEHPPEDEDLQTVQPIAWRNLAELYWELIYQGLALGDLRFYAAREALKYADQVLDRDNNDVGMHFLRGRLLATLKRHEEAETAFKTAIERGLSPIKAIPYLAELAYWRRDFPQVRSLITQLQHGHNAMALAPVVHYWESRHP